MPFQALQRPIFLKLRPCLKCQLYRDKVLRGTTKRWIGMKYLAKIADAEDQWQEKALRITAGKEKSMMTILEERGLINQFTGDRKSFDDLLTSRRVGAYVGIDPTASSLHIGNLVPLMALFWMYLHGYHTVSLLGGATAKIGDPTDRLTTRKREQPSIRTANMASMHFQLKKIWLNLEACGRKYGYDFTWANHRELVNNSTWWNKVTLLEVLQTMGPGIRMGSLLARDTVKQKMKIGDGMSFSEFSYAVMQAWDWWYMFHSKGIQLQIGGSDQFGNIAAGIDAIKYVLTTHPDPDFRSVASQVGEPVGFTVPLLTTNSGEKFGKSAGNAVWLDSDQTSSFELYGYFLRTADSDVEKYLKMFTFLPLPQIESLVKSHFESPQERKAQHKLAQEVVELAHGLQNAREARKEHNLLFGKPSSEKHSNLVKRDCSASGIVTMNNRPKVNIKLPESLMYQKMFGRIVHAVGFSSTLSEGRRLLQSSGVYIGTMPDRSISADHGHVTWSKAKDSESSHLKKYLVCGDMIMLRKGKHNIRIIQIVSDEEYVKEDLNYPGMCEDWKKSVKEAIRTKKAGTETDHLAVKEVGHVGDLLAEDNEHSQ